MQVHQRLDLMDDRGPVVEVVGVASPADGITVAAGYPGTSRVAVTRIEFPNRMVDPAAVALINRLTRR